MASASERLRRGLPATLSALAARSPVLCVFVVALAVRVIAAVVIAVGWGGSLLLDDASYSQLAEMAANGAVEDPYLQFLYERTATLLVPIAGLYALFGPFELLGQLYVALLGAATAALTARLAMEIMDRRFALFAGLVVALLPSQILWSSLILKDAAVWAVLSGLALVVAIAARSEGRRLALMGGIAALLLGLLGFLRLHTLEVACVAGVLAVLAFPRPRPLARTAGAAVLLAVVPFAFGMGVAGSTFVASSRDPGQQRVLNAIAADSAVVDAPAPATPDTTASQPAPAPTTPDKTTAPTASATKPGKTPPSTASATKPDKTPAPTATTPDAAPPAPAPALDPLEETSTVGSSLSYLPAGVTVVALRPWPWESSDTSLGVRMARAETIVWYPLLLLALVGLTSVWTHRRALAFPVIAGGAILALYGLAEGNLGTAFRHRGELVWVVALLAALGAERIFTWRGERHSPAAPEAA